jgi:hypothetical protein
MVKDGDKVEVTLNVLFVEDAEINALAVVLSDVAKLGNQTRVRDLCETIMKQKNEKLLKLLALFNTHV